MGLSPHVWFVVRLSIAYAACFLAAGTFGAWSTWADLLTRSHVFSSPSCQSLPVGKCPEQNDRLSSLYYVAMASGNVLAIPAGVLYDYTGPRVTGMVGFVGGAVSLLWIWLALQFKSLEPSLWVFVPTLNVFQTVASWGIFGFVFFYPGHVGLIMGICNSSFLISGLMMSSVTALMARGVAFEYGLLFLLGANVLACAMTLFACPSQREYEATCEAAFGLPSRSRPGFVAILRQLVRVIGLRPKQTVSYWSASAATNMAFAFWMGATFAFNNYAIGVDPSDELARLVSVLYAVIGIVASPLTGFLFDRTGMLVYSIVFLVLQLVGTALAWEPVFGVQVAGTIVQLSLYSAWLTFESKCPSLFAPADLYGSFLGLSNSLTGLVQLVVNLLIPVIIGKSLAGSWYYLAPMLALMALAALSLVVFIASLAVSPVSQPKLEEIDETSKLLVNASSDSAMPKGVGN